MERGADLAPPAARGSIKVGALGTEEAQEKKLVPQMVFTMLPETIELLIINQAVGSRRKSSATLSYGSWQMSFGKLCR